MGPRSGRLYASAVLRPLAEQLVAALGVQPGETACDLMCDSGTLGSALGAAVGRRGTVLLVDTDDAALSAAADDVSGAGCAVVTSRIDGRTISIADVSCDRAGSLCALGLWDDISLFAEAARIVRPSGMAALLTWTSGAPPMHEQVLVDALRDVAGVASPFLSQYLTSTDLESPGWDAQSVRDVVRFDGINQYWAAMVIERPVATELRGVNPTTLIAVRAACGRALQPFTAPDDTMLIPVTATVWRRCATDET